VACMGGRKVYYKVLVGNPKGKRPLGRPRCRWEDGIRMDFREIGWGVDWIRLDQDRDWWRAVVSAVMNLRVLMARSTLRISRESPCGGWRLWCGSGGKLTGGWTKGLLLVETCMTHQGVTLLHTY
jgi:hypothetical protein